MTAGIVKTEDELVTEYRTLYWYLNELQLCGVSWTDDEYVATSAEMTEIANHLGFVPAC